MPANVSAHQPIIPLASFFGRLISLDFVTNLGGRENQSAQAELAVRRSPVDSSD
jgi:hypothetical protein